MASRRRRPESTGQPVVVTGATDQAARKRFSGGPPDQIGPRAGHGPRFCCRPSLGGSL